METQAVFAKVADQAAIRSLASLKSALPALMDKYPSYLKDVASIATAVESSIASSILSGMKLPHLEVPPLRLAQATMGTLRTEAWEAVERTSGALMEELTAVVDHLDDTEKAMERRPEAKRGAKRDLILVMTALTMIFTFLASQRQIIETGFSDASLASQAIAKVGAYAIAVVAVAVAWTQWPRE